MKSLFSPQPISYLAIGMIFLTLTGFRNSRAPAYSTMGLAVVYLFTEGTGDIYHKSIETQLYIHDQHSLYIVDDQVEAGTRESVDDNGLARFDIVTDDGTGRAYHLDYQKGRLTARELIFDEVIIVTEAIPVIEWNLTNDKKEIAGYQTQRAVASFRGRTYSAWFTTEIPVNSGPWKFTGLPGLILEINDNEGRFNWFCKAVGTLTAEQEAQIQIPSAGQDVPTMEYGTYFDLAREKITSYFEQVAARAEMDIVSTVDFSKSLERTKD